MKITATAERNDDTITAQITVPAADVDAAIAKTYKDIAHQYNFQGFRRGRAPRPVIDSYVGRDYVLAETTNDVLNDVEPLMLEELDIVPLGKVEFANGDPSLVEEGKDYVVEASILVRPQAELSSYDPVDISMPPEEVTEAEIDWQLNQLLTYQVEYEDLEEQRPAVTGDYVSLSIENVQNAKHLDGDDHLIQVGSGQLPHEIEDAVLGMEAGQTKNVTWTRTNSSKEETNFEANVTLTAVKKAVIPEVSDEIAQRFGYDDVASLRDAVKDEVAANKKEQLPDLKENRVLDAVGGRLMLTEVPEAYENEIYNELASDLLNSLQYQNMSLDMYLQYRGIQAEDLVADLHSQADTRARESLALDALAAHLGFVATDEDVEEEFSKAGYTHKDVEEWRADGRLPAIRESIKRTKAIDWLVENANVTIVDEVAERAEAEAAAEEVADAAARVAAAAEEDAGEEVAAAEDAAEVEAEPETSGEAAAEAEAEPEVTDVDSDSAEESAAE